MKRRKGISTFSAQITSTISVALVLLLLGIVASLGIAARSATNSIKENMGFDITLKEDVDENAVNGYKRMFASAPYVSEFRYFSADDAQRMWKEETGEDLTELLGVNPFSPEFEVKVKAAYASTDSIQAIASVLENAPEVENVAVHAELVDTVNRNLRSLSVVLVVVAVALMLISFVLINNTIRLTVYSRRFIIHTMKLVGATAGFIRRPFIVSNVIHGIVAAIVAIILLALMLYYAFRFDAVSLIIGWDQMAWVFSGMLVAGVLICMIAALFATNRYLRINYDDMFK